MPNAFADLTNQPVLLPPLCCRCTRGQGGAAACCCLRACSAAVQGVSHCGECGAERGGEQGRRRTGQPREAAAADGALTGHHGQSTSQHMGACAGREQQQEVRSPLMRV